MWRISRKWCFVNISRICGIQHIQRGSSERPLNLFEAVYFVIVTLSTVGYGDISPDIWLGQLFMVIMICIAFSFIPRQVRNLVTLFCVCVHIFILIKKWNQCWKFIIGITCRDGTNNDDDDRLHEFDLFFLYSLKY